MQRAIWILWPSFIVGGLAETLFFALFDPEQMQLFGEPLGWSRSAIYSVGLLAFWGMAAMSSAFTCFLQRPAADINRLCPLEPTARPPGCPKREGAHGCRS